MSRKPLLCTEGSWFLTPSDWDHLLWENSVLYYIHRPPINHHTSVRIGRVAATFVLPEWSTSRSKCPRTNEAIQGWMSTWRHKKHLQSVPKRDARTRIMFSNDLFRIGNISTLPSTSLTQSMGNQGLERSSWMRKVSGVVWWFSRNDSKTFCFSFDMNFTCWIWWETGNQSNWLPKYSYTRRKHPSTHPQSYFALGESEYSHGTQHL